MLAFTPVIILLMAGLGIFLTSQFQTGLGRFWIIASVSSILAWVAVLFLHWISPFPVYIIGWNPIEEFTNLLGFQLDLIAWPFAFAAATLTVAAVFTSSARLDVGASANVWAVLLFSAGLGLAAITATTPLSIILTWTLIDIFELIVLQRMTSSSKEISAVITSFSIKLVSIFCISFAMIISRSDGNILHMSEISTGAGVLLLVSVVLRLGVTAWQLSYLSNDRLRRDPGLLLQSISAAAALVLLARLPDHLLSGGWHALIQAAMSLVALFCAGFWVLTREEIKAKPYWIMSVSALAVISVLNGYQITALVWGLVLILMGGLVSLFTRSDNRIQFIAAFAILNLLGLPFTPAAGIWAGLVDQPFNLFLPVYFIVHILLILGLVRHLFRTVEPYDHLERWIQAVYPAGLLMLILSHWVIATWGWPGSYTVGIWWASLIPILVISSGYILRTRTSYWTRYRIIFDQVFQILNKFVLKPVSIFFSFRWLSGVLSFLFSIVEYLINLITRMLEGEGAILWVLFLLAMLITLLFPGELS